MRGKVLALVLVVLSGCGKGSSPDTEARVSHWLEALRSPDVKERKEAAFKLGNLGLTDPGRVVPALTAALKDADAGVRCAALLALVKCGPTAREAVHKITELEHKDGDPRVRDFASRALAKIKEGR